ncbi:MAG: phosphoribosyltransferase [Pedosphaera sp.]|nr:phosphoribosyltransferase [Pedosphaera sp.]
MVFLSREEAGKELGRYLAARGVEADVVLGLPRGGAVVAAEVAHILNRPFDVLVVRKIGHPQQREFAVGALAEPGVVLLDDAALANHRVNRSELDEVIAEETERLHDYQAKFHPAGLPDLAHKRVLLVDDGLATGATMEAAVTSVKQQNAAAVMVAVPVASPDAVDRLARVADEVIALLIDPGFMAVGQYYLNFPQTTDNEVMALLPAHA